MVLFCFCDHLFLPRDCLRSVIMLSEEPEVPCPYRDDNYSCSCSLQEREIRAVCHQKYFIIVIHAYIFSVSNASPRGLICPILFLSICFKLVPTEEYERWLQRGLSVAESRCEGSYHCATPDCPGWCLYEDTVSVFHCPVCRKHNCLTCKVWCTKCKNSNAAKNFI